MSFVQGAAGDIVRDDLITSSNQSTPRHICGIDAHAVDPTLPDTGSCTFRTTPVAAYATYPVSCGVKAVKFASNLLALFELKLTVTSCMR